MTNKKRNFLKNSAAKAMIDEAKAVKESGSTQRLTFTIAVWYNNKNCRKENIVR